MRIVTRALSCFARRRLVAGAAERMEIVLKFGAAEALDLPQDSFTFL
jgi:hypothetical protein